MTPRPPSSTLFPYTTLFRSTEQDRDPVQAERKGENQPENRVEAEQRREPEEYPEGIGGCGALRSEEHTSELQSLRHLVCRLLLEKKKKNKIKTRRHEKVNTK